MKKILLSVWIILVGIPEVLPQEFLLHDQTYTWHADDDVCGGYSYWYDHGQAPTMDWTYPYDYQNGLFYYYFEIINQPSYAPFQLNFCIWAENNFDPVNPYWKESCGYRSDVLAGPGSWAKFSSPVLPAWNGGIDWGDLSKLWRYGIPLWVNGNNMGNGPYCTDHPEEWENQALYFPLTLRVVVVAVASGYSFSGWDNYLGGTCYPPAQPGNISGSTDPTRGSSQTYSVAAVSGATSYTWTLPSGWTGSSTTASITATVGTNSGTIFVTANNSCGSSLANSLYVTVASSCTPVQWPTPAYSVDYFAETTGKAVPTTDEYSFNANMSGAVSGNGQKINLIPGQDVYFRTKASGDGCYTASAVQKLDVPARPATPAFTVDFVNESTSETISAAYQYSTHSDMSGASSGDGSKINLVPGTTLYFRENATTAQFVSGVQSLVIPARPLPATFTLDYASEQTAEIVPATVEYANSDDMSGAISGTGKRLTLNPGSYLYFRVKSTSTSFASIVSQLVVDERPVMNTTAGDTVDDGFMVTIDFHKPVTGFDASDLDATNATVTDKGGLTVMVDPVAEGNVTVKVVADAVNSGNFASEVFKTYYRVASSVPGIWGTDLFLLVYPTPVGEYMHVNFSGNSAYPLDIRLMNSYGSLVFHKAVYLSESVVNVRNLPVGLYILKAIDAMGKEMAVKVLKQ